MKSVLAIFIFFAVPHFARATQILIVGDSHAFGPMGQELQASLKARGHQVERFAVIGSSSGNWLGPQKEILSFNELINKFNPQQIVISLGTNDVFNVCDNKSFSTKDTEKLLTLIPPSKVCFWIGPPGYISGKVINKCGKNYNKFVDQLKFKVATRCQFIDTRQAIDMMLQEKNLEKDTVHLNALGGKRWSQFILKRMNSANE